MRWLFDQGENTAALTSRQVLEGKFPILDVVHYDDSSWAFTCGTTNDGADARVVGMAEIIATDPTLHDVADLPLGWCATRPCVGGTWHRCPVSRDL
jgi:hypothetical protein